VYARPISVAARLEASAGFERVQGAAAQRDEEHQPSLRPFVWTRRRSGERDAFFLRHPPLDARVVVLGARQVPSTVVQIDEAVDARR
jgi:hypothetical protein